MLIGYLTVHDNKIAEKVKAEIKANSEKAELRSGLASLMEYQFKDSVRQIATDRKIDTLIYISSKQTEEIRKLTAVNKKLYSWLLENATTKAEIMSIMDVFTMSDTESDKKSMLNTKIERIYDKKEK